MPGIWARIKELIQEKRNTDLNWVPSHGNRTEREPPQGESNKEWRWFNHRADTLAGKVKEIP